MEGEIEKTMHQDSKTSCQGTGGHTAPKIVMRFSTRKSQTEQTNNKKQSQRSSYDSTV